MKITAANMHDETMKTATLVAASVRVEKRSRGMIGWRTRNSLTMKAAMIASPTRISPPTCQAVHP